MGKRKYERREESPRIIEKKKSSLTKVVVGAALVGGATALAAKYFPDLPGKMYKKLVKKPKPVQEDDEWYED